LSDSAQRVIWLVRKRRPDITSVHFATFVLRVSAIAFAGIGAAFLLAPASMGAFVGISLAGASADNDIRAVYGGLQLGCGALLWVASSRPEWLRPGLFAQLILFAGLAAGRVVSWVAVGFPDLLGLALHAAEVLAIAAGVTALLRLRR
jgi:hypothetical protein